MMSETGVVRRFVFLVVALAVTISTEARAQVPFDITDPTPRSVVVHIDDNYMDPSILGGDLKEAYTGSWSMDPNDPNTGIIVASAQDAFDAFAASSDAPVTPTDLGSWLPVIYRINVVTGHASITTGGKVLSTFGTLTFASELHTEKVDPVQACLFAIPLSSATYTTAKYILQPMVSESPFWCTDALDPYGCTLTIPDPFPYDGLTGRLNAVGPSQQVGTPGVLCSPGGTGFPAASGFGDAQLFEVPAPVPSFGVLPTYWAVLLLFGLLVWRLVWQVRGT